MQRRQLSRVVCGAKTRKRTNNFTHGLRFACTTLTLALTLAITLALTLAITLAITLALTLALNLEVWLWISVDHCGSCTEHQKPWTKPRLIEQQSLPGHRS